MMNGDALKAGEWAEPFGHRTSLFAENIAAQSVKSNRRKHVAEGSESNEKALSLRISEIEYFKPGQLRIIPQGGTGFCKDLVRRKLPGIRGCSEFEGKFHQSRIEGRARVVIKRIRSRQADVNIRAVGERRRRPLQGRRRQHPGPADRPGRAGAVDDAEAQHHERKHGKERPQIDVVALETLDR